MTVTVRKKQIEKKKYVHKDYPKMLYKDAGSEHIVAKNPEHHEALEAQGWRSIDGKKTFGTRTRRDDAGGGQG